RISTESGSLRIIRSALTHYANHYTSGRRLAIKLAFHPCHVPSTSTWMAFLNCRWKFCPSVAPVQTISISLSGMALSTNAWPVSQGVLTRKQPALRLTLPISTATEHPTGFALRTVHRVRRSRYGETQAQFL